MTAKEIEDSNIAAELQPADEIKHEVVIEKDENQKETTEVLNAILQAQEGEEKAKSEAEAEAEAEAAAAAAIAGATKDEESEGPAKKKQKVSAKDDVSGETVVGSEAREYAVEKTVQRKESHKEVERRRRETINTAINELRDLCSEQLHEVSKSLNGSAATTTTQITHSKSEVLNAACNYIKDLKNKLSALEMDFENYKSVSRVEINNVTSAKDALEEALANEKKN